MIIKENLKGMGVSLTHSISFLSYRRNENLRFQGNGAE